MKFIEVCVCVCVYGESCSNDDDNKKFFTNELNVGLPLRDKKQIRQKKNTFSPVKKKFWAQRSVKVMLTVFWCMKLPITIDFHEKGEAVNNAWGKIHLIYWMNLVDIRTSVWQ